jgi:mannose-6-phosphate isomerase-like protein (cupin superfamily)
MLEINPNSVSDILYGDSDKIILYNIISGSGIINIDGESIFISKGDFVTIPIEARYRIFNISFNKYLILDYK